MFAWLLVLPLCLPLLLYVPNIQVLVSSVTEMETCHLK